MLWLPKMTFQSSELQGKETEIRDDDANHDEAECHGFFKEANEDMLLEIFIRLPDCRSAKCAGIVCHNWHSLICHHPQFIPRFVSHHRQHQDRYPSPFAIIFRKADKRFTGVQNFQPICKIFSRDPKCCVSYSNYLDFLPSPMVIRGSCNDLMLVSPGSRWSTLHYICNPTTKQFYQLPEIQRSHELEHQVIGHALVCMPGPTNQFKVAEFYHPIFHTPNSELPALHLQPMTILCSESREWEIRCLSYPGRRRLCYDTTPVHFVSCNGILFWLENESRVDRVIYLDLTSKDNQCGIIALAEDSLYDPQYYFEQIGAVRVRGGETELRLIQVVLSEGMESISHLKVWKLNQDSKDWILVHHKQKFEMPKRDEEHQEFVAPFVHPANGDVVFVVWGTDAVFQFNLKDTATTYEIIDNLQEPLATNNGFLPIMDRLLPFPIVHPTWPTPLPTE